MTIKRLRCINRDSGYIEVKPKKIWNFYYSLDCIQQDFDDYLKTCNDFNKGDVYLLTADTKLNNKTITHTCKEQLVI